MMLTYLCVLGFLLGTTSAHVGNELIQKYGLKKIYESCFGEKLVQEKFDEFRRLVAECKEDDGQDYVHSGAGFNWQELLSHPSALENSPQVLPEPVTPEDRKARSLSYLIRQRRTVIGAAVFDEAKLRELKNDVIRKLKIATCVLQKKKILDADLNLQWEEMEKVVTKDYGFDQELRDDLIQAFNKCKDSVLCKALKQEPGKFPVALKQVKYFKKCQKKKKIEACLKNDLRKKPELFELEGLDGMLDDFESDEDKMLKVLKLSLKFGDDDAAFFN